MAGPIARSSESSASAGRLPVNFSSIRAANRPLKGEAIRFAISVKP